MHRGSRRRPRLEPPATGSAQRYATAAQLRDAVARLERLLEQAVALRSAVGELHAHLDPSERRADPGLVRRWEDLVGQLDQLLSRLARDGA